MELSKILGLKCLVRQSPDMYNFAFRWGIPSQAHPKYLDMSCKKNLDCLGCFGGEDPSHVAK